MTAAPQAAATHLRRLSCSTGVLVLLCLMYAITYVDRVNVSTAASLFKQDLHLTNAQVGLVFSAFAYPYLIFQIVGGWVSDRFGARLTLTVSALIWATATLLTGLVDGLAAMLVARVMLGFGEGATFPTATRAMADWTAESKRAFAQGITHSSARLGNALTPPLVAWLIALLTWRGSFILLGMLSLAWAAVWLWYFRDNPAQHPDITPAELKVLPPYEVPKHRINDPVPWPRLTRRMLPVTAVYFCYAWTLWLYLAWIPMFFLHRYQLDLQTSALFSGGVFVGGVAGDALGGLVSDYVYRKTHNLNRARRDLVVFGFLCSLAAMTPILFLHNVRAAALCLSLAFFFSELTIGPMWAIPMDIAPRFCGSASGLMSSGSALAAIISPLIAGYVIDKTGNWELPFLGSIGLLLIGSMMAFTMRPGAKLAGAALIPAQQAASL